MAIIRPMNQADTESMMLQTVAEADPIAQVDPAIWELICTEQKRQEQTIELIASENHVSPAVMAAMGTCLTNKYAEGYPRARYYQGCDLYDEIEQLAIERACELFDCRYANVQPHAGAQANAAVFVALLKQGESFASLVLADGGHLTHGHMANMSGKYFKPVHYPLIYDADHPQHEQIDYEAVRRICLAEKPKLIICGYSAYPRTIDFERFGAIAKECGALLMADIAHIAGLIAAGVHPSPFPHCHVVTTTTHKTMRGPRGGLILSNDPDIAAKIDRAVFPGTQGGPFMHIIAAKAVALHEALQPSFKQYGRQVVRNAAALAAALIERGYRLCSGGTDNHLMLVDLRSKSAELTGIDAAGWLESAGLITNMNGIPMDPRSPKVTSGVRLGTPAVTTRGFTEPQMHAIAEMIDRVLDTAGSEQVCRHVRAEVVDLCEQFPMPHLRC
jgi:glycine hydroxymethyltransferase